MIKKKKKKRLNFHQRINQGVNEAWALYRANKLAMLITRAKKIGSSMSSMFNRAFNRAGETEMPKCRYGFDSNEQFCRINGRATTATRHCKSLASCEFTLGVGGMLTGIIFHRKSMRIRWVPVVNP